MAITADLLDYPLSEILFFLASRNASGHLAVSSLDLEVVLTLNQGEIVAIESNDRRQRLGQRLVAAGTITADELTHVVDYLTSHPGATTIGSAVVELGLLSAGEVRSALQDQWTEQLFQILIQSHEGRFTFSPGPTSLQGVNADVGANGLVFEAMRRADEWLDEQLRRRPLCLAHHATDEHRDVCCLEDVRILHLLNLGPMTAGYLASWLDLPMETVMESLHRLYAGKLITLPAASAESESSEQVENADTPHQQDSDWHPERAIPIITAIHSHIRRSMVAS